MLVNLLFYKTPNIRGKIHKKRATGWTRTGGLSITNRLLYQLSYRGIIKSFLVLSEVVVVGKLLYFRLSREATVANCVANLTISLKSSIWILN